MTEMCHTDFTIADCNEGETVWRLLIYALPHCNIYKHADASRFLYYFYLLEYDII